MVVKISQTCISKLCFVNGRIGLHSLLIMISYYLRWFPIMLYCFTIPYVLSHSIIFPAILYGFLRLSIIQNMLPTTFCYVL